MLVYFFTEVEKELGKSCDTGDDDLPPPPPPQRSRPGSAEKDNMERTAIGMCDSTERMVVVGLLLVLLLVAEVMSLL